MDQEQNIDSILALDKQIKGHKGHGKTIIQLRRTRNSLLNVSTLPPELLGSIFRWNIIPCNEFDGLLMGSYNFLLVCHHWFEVASCTPELWSFWGNSIQQWTHRCTRCMTAPVDLVLAGHTGRGLGGQLRAALQDRAVRDLVRRVHLKGIRAAGLLASVISSIMVEGEDIRWSSIESFIVDNIDRSSVDVSTFFSRYHLPKLRTLRLSGCSISSWDLLKSRITTLTTLKLAHELSPAQTPSQLLSILSSNPLLQHLSLSPCSDPPTVDGGGAFLTVPLRHLKDLYLVSGFFDATFWLLNRLELPDKMADHYMFLTKCSPSDVAPTLGSYFGDRVRRRGRFPGGGRKLSVKRNLGLHLSMKSTHPVNNIVEEDWIVRVFVNVGLLSTDEEDVGICFDSIAYIPLEQVTTLEANLPILYSEELCVGMCNLINLHLYEVDVFRRFVDPDIRGSHTFREILPALGYLKITSPTLGHDGWGPLTNFLTRRAAVGNRISLFVLVAASRQMSPEVVESIERAVDVFKR